MRFVLAIVATLAFSSPVWAKLPIPDFSARVKVSITSQDAISAEVQSFIERELRSLGDVVVTDNDPEYILSVVAMTVTTKDGIKRGVAFAVVVLEPVNKILITRMAQEKYKDMVGTLADNLYHFSNQWVQVGSMNDIRSICSDIVAQFDTDELAPARKSWQSIKDLEK